MRRALRFTTLGDGLPLAVCGRSSTRERVVGMSSIIQQIASISLVVEAFDRRISKLLPFAEVFFFVEVGTSRRRVSTLRPLPNGLSALCTKAFAGPMAFVGAS